MAKKRAGKKPDPKKIAAIKKRIKPASKLPKRFRALFYGRSGHGKTRLSSTAPKCLLIDINEEGWDSVRKDHNPDVIPVYQWSDLTDVYWYLAQGDHPYEAFAFDGVTAAQVLCMKFVLGDEYSRDASRDPDMPSRQVWGKVGELMKTQITNYRNLPMHAIFTATQRSTRPGEDDDEDFEAFYSPNCSPAVADHLERSVGMIAHISKRQVYRKEGKKKKRVTRTRLLVGPSDRYMTKDRYGLHVPHIDGPSIPKILEAIYGGK